MGTPSSLSAKIPPRALLRLALYYGVAGFGGGYSVLAQLRRDLVDERRWIDAEEFLIFAELSKSLPGTPATSLIALLGQRMGGTFGGILAATAFLLPSMFLMIVCGAGYSVMRRAMWLGAFFDGMNAAMVGVVAATTLDLGRSALRNRWDVAASLGCAGLLAARVVGEPVIAVTAIAFGMARGASRPRKPEPSDGPAPKGERLHGLSPWMVLLGSGFGALTGLVRVFVPIGVTTFGGGLAMIPAIEHTVVVEQHWLDATTFADAVALGQITPGPVAICATFIGYRVGGLLGALSTTLAMFAPAIAVTLAVGHSIDHFRQSPLVAGALRALAPAVIGMLAAATFSLGHAGVPTWHAAVVALVSFGFLVRFKVSPLWPLACGGLIHLFVALLRTHA